MAVRKGYVQTAEHVRRRVESKRATLQSKPKPVSKEWLENEYIHKGRDCVQIGAELHKDPKTIWEWLRHYGIPTRPRGGATAPGTFKKGAPNAFKGRRHSPETRERIRQVRLTDGRVPYLQDGAHWLKGKSGTETPNWKGGITPERQAFYTTEEWRSAVKQVWARSVGHCERCGTSYSETRRIGGKSFHIHHIEGFAVRELRSVLSNLVLLCRPCHHYVHSAANVTGEFVQRSHHASR